MSVPRLNKEPSVRLGIDASNIRAGGGQTHLIELLAAARPDQHGFDRVIVWSNASTLSRIGVSDWLCKVNIPALQRSLPKRVAWQQAMLQREAAKAQCDVLFVPGGTYLGSFRPYVAMSQNLLPFEWQEARRYGLSSFTSRFLLLRGSQSLTFRRSNGTIFLTEYARNTVLTAINRPKLNSVIIPHGVDDRFRAAPRTQAAPHAFSDSHPFRLLYVSTVAPYKHQAKVIEAVELLRNQGLPITIALVGAMDPPQPNLMEALHRIAQSGGWAEWQGHIPFESLPRVYYEADAFVFASSCENLPNILLEAMASGLPIASSDRGPMPEVLGKAGVYFDPEDAASIAAALQLLFTDSELRGELASSAYEEASRYSWQLCAERTFAYIAQVARESGKGNPA